MEIPLRSMEDHRNAETHLQTMEVPRGGNFHLQLMEETHVRAGGCLKGGCDFEGGTPQWSWGRTPVPEQCEKQCVMN